MALPSTPADARISRNLEVIAATVEGIIKDLYKLERLRIATRDLMSGAPTKSNIVDPIAMRVVARHLAMNDGELYSVGGDDGDPSEIDERDATRQAMLRLDAILGSIKAQPSMPTSEIAADLIAIRAMFAYLGF